jgi:hypothetical protein
MLYRFKSRATHDIVMLGHDARHLIEIWGKDPLESGVLLVEDMAQAAERLVASAEHADEAIMQARAHAHEHGGTEQLLPDVNWHARIQPMLAMIKQCQEANQALRWEI